MLRKSGFWIVLIVLALAAGGGYAYYITVYLPGQEPPAPVIKTAQVSQGDLVISVSGSGTLVPAAESELGFESGGYLKEVLVEVGDRVREGDVLARLETDDLELAVAEADIKARQAQLDLADASEGVTEAELASAEAALKSAQAALTVAQYSYNSARNSDFDASVRAYLIHYQWYTDQYCAVEQSSTNPEHLQDAWNERSQAEAGLNDAQREAQMEQLDVWNQVDQAKNKVYQAQEKLASLQSGPAEDTVLRAQLKADQAALALEEARANLAAAELRAPFDGVVVDVAAIPGQHVTTAAIITLVDLEEPLLQFWVEEADMSGVAMGNRVETTFEALPDDVFAGEVVRVDPALVTVDRTLAVQAWTSIDLASQPVGDQAIDIVVGLAGGMNAEVEVIYAESRDTLLIPVQALRELGPDQYAVFVVQPDGELLLRPVEVGLQDFVNAEILSGLEAGETVSTGFEESTGTGVSADEMDEMPMMEPGTRMLEGGGMPGGGGPPGGP